MILGPKSKNRSLFIYWRLVILIIYTICDLWGKIILGTVDTTLLNSVMALIISVGKVETITT